MRPGASVAGPPICCSRISRVQLIAEPVNDQKVRVRSVGRAVMRINGRATLDGTASVGDVVEIHNAALFLVSSRPTPFAALRSYAAPTFAFGSPDSFGMVGEGERTWELREALAFAATTEGHVLLLGESGVGKELAARSVHGLSNRRDKALVARNAATLPEALIDAELFGNVKNYPNPGMPERPGLVGEADGSTLFLDEIGDLPEKSQVHLLRVLDSGGEYQRLGDAKPRRASFRLIAATNRPLDSLKHDFLARFIHRVSIPGLADRREEVPLVLAEMLRKVARSNKTLAERFFERRNGQVAEPRLAPDLVLRLLRHPFTHHVRELERLLWLALTSAQHDYIGITSAVEAELKDSAESETEQQSPTAIDRETLVQALVANGRSPTRTAKALGLKNRYVLLRLLKKHGLSAGDDREGTQ
jgi:two-component system nitrogen regulation response regulator GlnG/two-component system response regulator HydG